MNDIMFQRKIGIFYHAVGLGNAGESPERKKQQHDKRRLSAHAADAAGDF